MRSFLFFPALLLLVLASAGGAAVSGSPAPPLYLALGDSLAAGVGASQPAQIGYVGLVFNALSTEPASPYSEGGLDLLNLGDPGETTTSIRASGGQMEKALAEIESRRDDDIAGNEVAVITIDIGANDFIPLLLGDSPCLPNPLASACQEAAAAALSTFRSNFTDIMRGLRAAAGPEVEMVALGLYNPLSGTGGPLDSVGDAALGLFNSTVAAVIADPAIEAALADIFPSFQHRGPELTHMAEMPPDIHPNDSGHYLMARAVLTALGLPADAVATPSSGAPPLGALTPSPTPRATASLPTATAAVRALPSAGTDGDDGPPWVLYIVLISAGAAVAAALVVAARRLVRGR